MYVRGKISDLKPIDTSEVEEFIISPMDEIDFFECSTDDFLINPFDEIDCFKYDKENLTSLNNYLIELKEQKKEYDRLIAKPLNSIQEKNSWCKDIQPAIGDTYFMRAQAKNYPSIFIGEKNDNLVDSEIANTYPKLKEIIFGNRVLNRLDILNNSKEELLEIKRIIQSFGFVSEDEGFITISKHFLIVPYSFEEVHIQKKRKTSRYHIIKINKNGEFTSNYCGMTYFDQKKSKNYADSFSKKLYLAKDK